MWLFEHGIVVFKVRLVVNTSESVAMWLFVHGIVVFKVRLVVNTSESVAMWLCGCLNMVLWSLKFAF